jgi:hypothetical protein
MFITDAKDRTGWNVTVVGRYEAGCVSQELMKYMIDPIADNVFESVKIITTKDGVIETQPRTDDDWGRIRIGAVTIAEGAYLLKVRRPFAPDRDLNNSSRPDAVELSPTEIVAKIENDLVEWNARIEALRNVGLEVLDIVKKKDVSELWDAGENLDTACESCHRSYWYPKETPEFYHRLERRLSDHFAAPRLAPEIVKPRPNGKP